MPCSRYTLEKLPRAEEDEGKPDRKGLESVVGRVDGITAHREAAASPPVARLRGGEGSETVAFLNILLSSTSSSAE